MKPELIAHLVAATEEVFGTMISKTLNGRAPVANSHATPTANVAATVGFAGGVSGLVAFYGTFQAAREITGAMLGMAPEEVNGEMADAIGEVANMIAGSFRSRIAAEGLRCDISIPTVTLGSEFSTSYVSDVTRILCPFEMDRDEIFVELIVNNN